MEKHCWLYMGKPKVEKSWWCKIIRREFKNEESLWKQIFFWGFITKSKQIWSITWLLTMDSWENHFFWDVLSREPYFEHEAKGTVESEVCLYTGKDYTGKLKTINRSRTYRFIEVHSIQQRRRNIGFRDDRWIYFIVEFNWRFSEKLTLQALSNQEIGYWNVWWRWRNGGPGWNWSSSFRTGLRSR